MDTSGRWAFSNFFNLIRKIFQVRLIKLTRLFLAAVHVQVDEQLAVALFDVLQISLMTLAGVVVACVVLPPVVAFVPPVFAIMAWLRK